MSHPAHHAAQTAPPDHVFQVASISDLAAPPMRSRREPGEAVLDQALANTRWLVVDADPATARNLRRAIGSHEGVTIEHVADARLAARRSRETAAAGDTIDFLVIEASLADFDAAVKGVTADFPEARLVVASRQPTAEEAIDAFRRGALDFLPASAETAEWSRRLRLAAGRRWLQVRNDRRLVRLKQAVRQLNVARRTVSQKVDLLCNDFVGAYGDIARQVERVRLDRALRDLLAGASDLEQMLCHLMDWLLKHAGKCNIAIFLADEQGEFELGAYMKHSVAGEPGLVGWLRNRVIPKVIQSGGLLNAAPEVFSATIDAQDPQQVAMLHQCVLGVDCEYLAESLGMIVLFRPDEAPFTDEQETLLKGAAAVFAEALTTLVHREEAEDAAEGDADDDEEWWQRGDAAPY